MKKISKLSKILIAVATIASMFTMTVYAKEVNCTLTRDAQNHQSNTKDRTANTWLMTNTNMNSTEYFQSGDIALFRIRATPTGGTNTAMSDNMVVKSFITNYAYPYTVTPVQGQSLYLFGQVGEESARPTFKYFGKWFT